MKKLYKKRYPGIYKIWLRKVKALRSDKIIQSCKVFTPEEKQVLEAQYRAQGLIK